MLLKAIVGVKSLWTLKDSWIQVVIEAGVIAEVFLVGGREPKQMPVHGKARGAGLPYGKSNFLTNSLKRIATGSEYGKSWKS
jgi:hypothetical protein